LTSKTAAHRYARALFDVALAEKADLVRIEQQLTAFTDLFTTHELLGKVLLNPAVPAPRKRAAVEQVTMRIGMPAPLAKILTLLAERDRLVILPDLVRAYRDRLMDHQKVVRAELTTASPLAAERAKAIERVLAKTTGRTVTIDTRVDPAIVGGIVARLGSTVYDASVATQLEKMRRQLAERM
jgi:F-type H+-transporting ATPase subunit delta